MKIQDVLTKLCIWDKRNPTYPVADRSEDEPKDKLEDCYCDACFCGRHELADQILHLSDVIKGLQK